MRGLIAFNVIDEDVLYNKEYPRLVYYDGKEDIKEAISGIGNLKEWLMSSVITLDNYETCELRYVTYFTEDDKESSEEYTEHGKLYIKDIIGIGDICEAFVGIALKTSFGTDDIEELRSRGLTDKTITNGLRSSLSNSSLTRDTVTAVIKKFQETL